MFTHKNRPIPVRGETTPAPSLENCKTIITKKLYRLGVSAFRYPQPVSLSKPELEEIAVCRYFCTAVFSSPHLLPNTLKGLRYELCKRATEAGTPCWTIWLGCATALIATSRGGKLQSYYHLSTCSSFSTQTSFGQTGSSPVYNSVSAEGFRNCCWLPGTGHLYLVSWHGVLADIFSWCIGWDWVCIRCVFSMLPCHCSYLALKIKRNKSAHASEMKRTAYYTILRLLKT